MKNKSHVMISNLRNTGSYTNILPSVLSDMLVVGIQRSGSSAGALMWSVHSTLCACLCANRSVVVVSQSLPFRNPKAATGGTGLNSMAGENYCMHTALRHPTREMVRGGTVLLQHDSQVSPST